MNTVIPNTDSIIPFWYVVNATAGGSSSITTQLTLQTDSIFELQAILGSSDQDGPTDFYPNNFSVQITDQSTGRQLTSQRVQQKLITGPTNQSILERQRLFFPSQATLLFDFLDLSGNDNAIQLVLKGYKHLRV